MKKVLAVSSVPAPPTHVNDASTLTVATTNSRTEHPDRLITVHGMYADQLNVAYVFSYRTESSDGNDGESEKTSTVPTRFIDVLEIVMVMGLDTYRTEFS